MVRALFVLIPFAVGAELPQGSISGRVIDAVTGAPIAGARLVLNQADAISNATTDADGRYTFTKLGNGSYQLRVVTAPGFLTRAFGDEPLIGPTPVAPMG